MNREIYRSASCSLLAAASGADRSAAALCAEEDGATAAAECV
jgi:hypothetical protein